MKTDMASVQRSDATQMSSEITRDVIVLGAGFSRALSPRMPLTDELGNECLVSIRPSGDPRIPAGGFSRGNFETWLSGLADEQPYLSAQENLENQALFLRFSEAIAKVLGDRVYEVLDEDWLDWLPEFIRVAHRRLSTLITFNYDPLIECAVGRGILEDWTSTEPVYWAEVIGDVPNWAPGVMRFVAPAATTFRLLKLHGSLNWYWASGDQTGASIARRDIPGIYGDPRRYTEEDRRRELPGRVPLIVPPAAAKSSYYRNPVIRDAWVQAAESLRRADRVFVVGYSLPLTDLTFAGLLGRSLANTSAKVVVVDLNPDGIIDRLRALGIQKDRIGVIGSGGGSPIEEFVSFWRDELAIRAARELREKFVESLDDPISIFWKKELLARVIGFERTEQGLDLITETPSPSGQAILARGDSEHPPLPHLRDVVDSLSVGGIVRARIPGGSRPQVILGNQMLSYAIGYGRGIWNALWPSGAWPER